MGEWFKRCRGSVLPAEMMPEERMPEERVPKERMPEERMPEEGAGTMVVQPYGYH